MRYRAFVLAAAVAFAAAEAAHAHTTGAHAGYQSTVSYIKPQQPGLLVRVLGGHVRLSVANLTRKDVVIFDARRRPFVRIAAGQTRMWRDPRIGSTDLPPHNERTEKSPVCGH